MDLIKYVYWNILISGKRADSEKFMDFVLMSKDWSSLSPSQTQSYFEGR